MAKNRLIYDGDCPFCSRYAALVRFRKAAGPVDIVNAREHPEVVREMAKKGIDIDKGMALDLDGCIYHSADALNRIALMSTGSGVFNAVTATMFRSKTLSKTMYPVLKAARRVALHLKGKKGIE